jgi:hypothetical protein
LERESVYKAIRDEQFREFVFAMLETGCRPSEVAKVTARHVSQDWTMWIFELKLRLEAEMADGVYALPRDRDAYSTIRGFVGEGHGAADRDHGVAFRAGGGQAGHQVGAAGARLGQSTCFSSPLALDRPNNVHAKSF